VRHCKVTTIARYWLTPTRSPALVNPRIARSHHRPHRLALRPSPFHRRTCTSSISSPITPIASCPCLQALRRQARPLFPFVSLSRASFLVLNSRFVSIIFVLYRFATIIVPLSQRFGLLMFSLDRPLVRSSPFTLLVSFHF